jgi:hypothetical protein
VNAVEELAEDGDRRKGGYGRDPHAPKGTETLTTPHRHARGKTSSSARDRPPRRRAAVVAQAAARSFAGMGLSVASCGAFAPSAITGSHPGGGQSSLVYRATTAAHSLDSGHGRRPRMRERDPTKSVARLMRPPLATSYRPASPRGSPAPPLGAPSPRRLGSGRPRGSSPSACFAPSPKPESERCRCGLRA